MQLDWAAQRAKARHVPAAHDKAPLRTVGLVVGGGLAGKAAAASATKLLLGKLASPFGAKAVTAVGSSAAGGAVGAVGGPAGAVAGAAIGLGVDYLINSGVALMQRPDFEAGVHAALAATEAEW